MNEKVKMSFVSESQEYSELITRFISSHNPDFHSDPESKVDAIMNVFIASRNIRLGPAPSIESQFEMRKVIRYYIHENEPIPILIPSGPKKTNTNEGIDLAELSMLNILNCLNNEVKKHYYPGIRINLRLEDLTGKVLEPEFIEDMDNYITQMENLIKVLDYSFINPWRESKFTNGEKFLDLTADYRILFGQYIMESNSVPEDSWANLASYKLLVEKGWNGLISSDQREMYMVKYAKLYPELPPLKHMELMCKYFAASLARKNLFMTGKDLSWIGGNLEIAFMAPVPTYTYSTRFYYRSIELKNSKLSIPFWRAKGFLKISEDNTIRISSCTWKDADSMEFNKAFLVMSRGEVEVKVQCDYILAD